MLGKEVMRRLYERVVVATVLYGAEAWCAIAEERRMLNVVEMKYFTGMAGETLRDRIYNKIVWNNMGIVGSW